jgi:hypothetical protein
VSDIDTAVVDSLTCLTPKGRLEKQTFAEQLFPVTLPTRWTPRAFGLFTSSAVPSPGIGLYPAVAAGAPANVFKGSRSHEAEAPCKGQSAEFS